MGQDRAHGLEHEPENLNFDLCVSYNVRVLFKRDLKYIYLLLKQKVKLPLILTVLQSDSKQVHFVVYSIDCSGLKFQASMFRFAN